MVKTILHLDMNSYFATVEQQANPYLRGKPVGIIKAAGRGCIIAASIEAKKFKIKTGTTVWEARKLCPQIILVPSDMDKYFAVTQGLIHIVSDYSPTVEVFSIDEMFVDISDTQKLFAGGALAIALEMKQRIKQELGDWLKCSIGISYTKLLAKLASEMDKPNGLTFLTSEDYLEKTAGLPVDMVCGIGYARTTTLQSMGVRTLGEARLRQLPQDIDDLVWLRTNNELITMNQLNPAKSVSRTYTTFSELTTQNSILKLVRNLVEETCAKLREMHMAGRTFCLSLSGGYWSRLTVSNPTADPLIILNLLWNEYLKNPIVGIRQAGVWISNLVFNIQYPIFNKRDKALEAVDQVNDKFGLFTVYPAQLLGDELIRPEVTGYLGDKYYRVLTNKF